MATTLAYTMLLRSSVQVSREAMDVCATYQQTREKVAERKANTWPSVSTLSWRQCAGLAANSSQRAPSSGVREASQPSKGSNVGE